MANIGQAIGDLRTSLDRLPPGERERLIVAAKDGMDGFRKHAADWDHLVSSEGGQGMIKDLAPHFSALILDAMTGALDWGALYKEFCRVFPETIEAVRAPNAISPPPPDGRPMVASVSADTVRERTTE